MTSRNFTRKPGALVVVDRGITDLGEVVEVIVSGDDNYLSHGGGVSEAIWKRYGESLSAWTRQPRRRPQLADVLVAPVSEADGARVILHAITIDFDKNRALSASEVATLYRRCIHVAERAASKAGETWSLAVPLLGAGAAGLTAKESLQGLSEAVRQWRRRKSAVNRILVSAPGPSYALANEELATSESAEVSGRRGAALAQVLDQLVGGVSRDDKIRVSLVALERMLQVVVANGVAALPDPIDRAGKGGSDSALDWSEGRPKCYRARCLVA